MYPNLSFINQSFDDAFTRKTFATLFNRVIINWLGVSK